MVLMIYIKSLLTNKIFVSIFKQKARDYLLSFVFCFLYLINLGQVNYVINPSFEDVDICGGSFYINNANGWDSLKGGGGGGNSNSDCFNTNVLDQLPRSGRAYAYMNYFKSSPASVSWRSYIQTQLIKKLLKDKKYCVTHYANLLNRSQYAIDELGLYFDSGTIATILPAREAIVNPQVKSPTGVFYSDTLNWMKVQGTFTATGTENYLTLGNFKSYATATYSLVYPLSIGMVAEYYIDDVSVIEADLPPYAGRDTVLCNGDSVFIGRPPEVGLECIWFNNASQIATGGGLYVKPTTSQNYIVHQDVCGIITKDTVFIQVKPKFIGTPQIQSSSLVLCPNDTTNLIVINTPTLGTSYNWQSNLSLKSYTNTFTQAKISNTIISAGFYDINISIKNDGSGLFCPFIKNYTITIEVSDTCFKELVIPNIFTPNDDNVNDVWRFKMPFGARLNSVYVYNRWGALIYSIEESILNENSKINTINWDGHTTSGEVCGSGVYFYLIKYTNRFNEFKDIKGNVSLIR